MSLRNSPLRSRSAPLLLSAAVALMVLVPLGARSLRQGAASRQPAPHPALAAPQSPPRQAPVCAAICDLSGVNFAYPVRQPSADYLRAQRLGMGWSLEIAYHPSDLLRAAEGMNRALARGLTPILRICAGATCEFSDPSVYAAFLHDLAPLVPGEFWALMGPNEPDLETWAGDAVGVAAYMNAVLAQTDDIPNLRTLSPAFNATNGVTHRFFKTMEQAGARFADLDGFAVTSYTVSGNGAYYYYAKNSAHSERLREKALRFNKPVVFVEYGTFGMFDRPDEGDPRRAQIVQEMRNEFLKAAADSTVMAILHFDAFGTNGSLHRYYDPEMIEIARDADCRGGAERPAGIGITTEQTIWQLPGEPACREVLSGCPFIDGTACGPDACIDNDRDGLPGDGGACPRTDCDDTHPMVRESCASGPAAAAAWGTIRPVDDRVADDDGDVTPAAAIGADGLPLIVYHDDRAAARDLVLLRCTTPDCSAAHRRVLVSDDFSGMYPAIQVRPDGRPIIVHFDRVDDDLEIYDCHDPGCASGERRIIDYNTGFYGLATSLALRLDGRPIVAYWNSVGLDLNAYDCADAACSSGAIRVLDDSPDTGRAPSILVGLDGEPLIAYWKLSSEVLRVFDCADAGCAGGTRLTLDYDPSESFSPHGIALRPDGTPVIIYRDRINAALHLMDCHDATCSSRTERVLDDSGEFYEGSVTILYDGAPFIAYRQVAPEGNMLKLLRCLDPGCASTVIETAVAGGVGRSPDVVRRVDGNPLVVYLDGAAPRLMVYDVDLSLVPGGAGVTPTPSHTPSPTLTPVPTSTLPPTDTPTPTETPTPTLTPTPLAAAAPVKPTSGTWTAQRTPKLKWGRVAGASSYEIQIANTAEFTDLVFAGVSSGNKLRIPEESPLDYGQYFWRVRALADGNAGPWSVPFALLVTILKQPASGVTTADTTPTFKWESVSGAVSYELEVDDSVDFAEPLLIRQTTQGVSFTPGAPLPPGTFYWRVRAILDDGATPWMPAWSFTVQP